MKTKYTDEQLAEFLTQSDERFYRRYCDEFRKELWERFQNENNKTKEVKEETETVIS